MARIFITGSSDGIGQTIARTLISQGHSVTLHARSPARAEQALTSLLDASGILIGDLSSISQTVNLAQEANKTGAFDTVIHNAGMGYRGPFRKTEDGIADVFAVNALAPYILTALMERPRKLVYVSSGLHTGGDSSLEDVTWTSGRRWNGFQAYCDSKLMNVVLSFAVARHWPEVSSNALSPRWVKTKMGGSSTPRSVERGAAEAIKLANSDPKAISSGEYYASTERGRVSPAAKNENTQERFLKICEEISGVAFPK